MKNFLFEIFKWFIKLFNIAFISIFILLILVFLIELVHKLPILKDDVSYDPVSISNTFIVYVTFIFVIGSIGLTLAGFYFQRSIAKREGEILNENMDKVLNAIAKDEDGFREKLVKKLLEHKKIKPLIQQELDQRVEAFKSELEEQREKISVLEDSIVTLGDGFNNLSASSGTDITFDIGKKKDEE